MFGKHKFLFVLFLPKTSKELKSMDWGSIFERGSGLLLFLDLFEKLKVFQSILEKVSLHYLIDRSGIMFEVATLAIGASTVLEKMLAIIHLIKLLFNFLFGKFFLAVRKATFVLILARSGCLEGFAEFSFVV